MKTMKIMNWKVIITAVFCVFLTTACSKKLMPPEIETSGSVSEGTEFGDSSSSSDSAFAGSNGSEDSGFFSEEPILEQGASGGFVDSGSGSSSFDSNPFASNGQGGQGGQGQDQGQWNPGDSGSQESRLQSFHASSELKDIHFKFDRYDLDDNSREILKQNAEFLKNNPNVHVEVQGHCDERGTNNYNIALGERRAHSTKKFLESQGVDSRNLHIISYGEEKPFCFESGETCWYQNRRAHFMVSK